MKIQDALKETEKAQHQSNLYWFVEVGVNGFLNWYEKYNPYIMKGGVKYAATVSDDWKPYHPPACACGKKGCVDEKAKPKCHKVVYCEKKWECEWQGFALHHGLGWGILPSMDYIWRQKHSEKCGGKLIEAVI